MSKEYYTSIKSRDGFGAQYQRIIQTYIVCKNNNLNFVYTPLEHLEHNYDNDKDYNNKLENLINFKKNITNTDETMNVKEIDYGSIILKQFESKIDYFCESQHMQFIKDCFWENKNRDCFKNDKINVAVHIRRDNISDKGAAGDRVTTPNSYYFNIMNTIRDKKACENKQLLFHVYSQGELYQFQDLSNNDVNFYINSDIIETFIGMVSADILITSPSSFSYVAALISDGEIHYKKFWHEPRKEWIIHK